MAEQANTEQAGVERAGAGQSSTPQVRRGRPHADEMRLMRIIMWSGAVLVVVALVAFALTAGVTHISKRAPRLPKQRLTGPPVTLASLKGEPALILFWASWCGECGKEAAAVRRFASSPAGRGRIVGVDWGDHAKAARRFLRQNDWTFTNLRDKSGQIGLSYGLTKLPALFVIDSHSNIVKAISGAQSEQQLRAALLSK